VKKERESGQKSMIKIANESQRYFNRGIKNDALKKKKII